MSVCAMEVEPSGSSPCCVAWQPDVRGTADDTSAAVYVAAASASKAMQLRDAAVAATTTACTPVQVSRSNVPVRLCSVEELAKAMCDKDAATNLLIIDTRSFLEFNTMRVQTAVNVCCNKIIKRRLQNDKVTIKELLESNCSAALPDKSTHIILYDQCTQEPTQLAADCFLAVLLAKLAREFPNVALLRGGFLQFNACFSQLCQEISATVDTSRAHSNAHGIARSSTITVSTPVNNNQPGAVNQNFLNAAVSGCHKLADNGIAAAHISSALAQSQVQMACDGQQCEPTLTGKTSTRLSVRVEAARCAVSPLTESRSPGSGCAMSEPSTPMPMYSVMMSPPFGTSSIDDCDGMSKPMMYGAASMASPGASASAPSALKRERGNGQMDCMPLAERARLLSPGTGASGAVSGPCLPVTHLGPSRILPFLYLGSQDDAFNVEVMKANGISHVINVSATCPQTSLVRGENFLRIAVDDSYYERLSSHFHKAFEFIERARAENGCTLVHCLAGISRSPTITIAFVMRLKGVSSDEAYKLVKRARPAIAPNFNFLGQLLEYERLLQQEAQKAASGGSADTTSPTSSTTSSGTLIQPRAFKSTYSSSTLSSASTLASPHINASSPSVADATAVRVSDSGDNATVSQSKHNGPDLDSVKPQPTGQPQPCTELTSEVQSTRKVTAHSFVSSMAGSTKLRHVETIVCHSALHPAAVTLSSTGSCRIELQSEPVINANADVSCSSKRPCLPQTRSLDKCASAGEKRSALANRRSLLTRSSTPKFDFSMIHNSESQSSPATVSAQPQLQLSALPVGNSATGGSHTPTTPTVELAKLSFGATQASSTDIATCKQPIVKTAPQSRASALLLEYATSNTASLKMVTFTTCANTYGNSLRPQISVRSSISMPLSPMQHHVSRTPSPSRRQTNLLGNNSHLTFQAASNGSSARLCVDERENLEKAAIVCESWTATRSWKSMTNVSTVGCFSEADRAGSSAIGGYSNNTSLLIPGSGTKQQKSTC